MGTITESARPLRGRRLSWKEYMKLTGRPEPKPKDMPIAALVGATQRIKAQPAGIRS